MNIDPNRFKRNSREALQRQPMMHARRQAAVSPVTEQVQLPTEHSPAVASAPIAPAAETVPQHHVTQAQPIVELAQNAPLSPQVAAESYSHTDNYGNDDYDYDAVDWTSAITNQPANNTEQARLQQPVPVETPVKRRSLARSLAYGFGILVLFVGSVAAGVMSGKPQQSATSVATAPKVLSEQSTGSSDIKLSVGSDNSLSQGTNTGTPMVKQYTDKFQGAELNIVVQYAPDNFKADPAAALKQLATNLKATAIIPTQSWGAGYLRTDDAGNQVVVFANKTYLVVVQSKQKVVLEDWRGFVENFKP